MGAFPSRFHTNLLLQKRSAVGIRYLYWPGKAWPDSWADPGGREVSVLNEILFLSIKNNVFCSQS